MAAELRRNESLADGVVCSLSDANSSECGDSFKSSTSLNGPSHYLGKVVTDTMQMSAALYPLISDIFSTTNASECQRRKTS